MAVRFNCVVGAGYHRAIPLKPSNIGLAGAVQKYASRFFVGVLGAALPICGIKMMGAPAQSNGHLIVPIVAVGTLSMFTNSVQKTFGVAFGIGALFASLRDGTFIAESTSKPLAPLLARDGILGKAMDGIYAGYQWIVKEVDSSFSSSVAGVQAGTKIGRARIVHAAAEMQRQGSAVVDSVTSTSTGIRARIARMFKHS